MKGLMLLKRTVSKSRELLRYFSGLKRLRLTSKTAGMLPHIRTQENGSKSVLTKEPLLVLQLVIILSSETQAAGHVTLKSLPTIKWISASTYSLTLKLQE